MIHPFILAPMAGCTDLPFRLLCREYGADLCYSEMIDCHDLVALKPDCLELLQTNVAEQPVAMQLFGSDPATMGEAAAILSEYPIACIDINLGCPMEKVIQQGAGAALMKNPRLAEKIITSVCKNSTKPVTIKIRSGWNQHTITAPEIARIAEDAGAQAIAIHARTWSDGFTGPIDHRVILQTMAKVSLPVFANGDITSHEQGLALLKKIGCAGVMIGRAAIGNPWIFKQIFELLDGNSPHPVTIQERIHIVKQHLAFHVEQYGQRGVMTFRKHMSWYFRGIEGAKPYKQQLHTANTHQEVNTILDSIAEDPEMLHAIATRDASHPLAMERIFMAK